jgi:Mg-chelatase subunit ChlD
VTAREPLASAEVLRQVRRLEVRTRRTVDSRFAGEYRSVFKGQGVEFAEVREYHPGDEVRAIDWNVSARMGRPFVRRFEEERELTVLFAIDTSASAGFGTGERTKLDVARELVAVLALTAARHNDRVGLLLFSDRVERMLPPRKGRRQALRVLRELVRATPARRGAALEPVADVLARLLPHRGVLFVVSDFLDGTPDRPLARLAQRHDVVAVTVQDPAERHLPDVGPACFEDPETGARLVVDTSAPTVRRAFAQRLAAGDAARERLFARLGIDEVRIDVGHGILPALQGLFRARMRRRRGAVRVASRLLLLAAVWLGVPATPTAAQAVGQGVGKGAGAPSALGQAAGSPPTVRVLPDTVTVGDPFLVEVAIPVGDGRVVRWPVAGDSTAPVAPRGDPAVTTQAIVGGGRLAVARYPLAAWVTGTVPVGLPAVEVEDAQGRRLVPIPPTAVIVRSVLPLDTTQHRPRPAREPFPRVPPWWERWGIAGAVVAALLTLAWWVRRRRQRPKPLPTMAADPLVEARAAFQRLEQLALAEAGEGALQVGAALDIVRRYLAARVPRASRALTSAELLAELGHDPRVPTARLVSLLAEGDRAKFAPSAVEPAQARALAREARALVEAVDDAAHTPAAGGEDRAPMLLVGATGPGRRGHR